MAQELDLEILGEESQAPLAPRLQPAALWRPVIGRETSRLLEAVPHGAAEGVRTQALEVLSRCCDPTRPGRRTGLIVGYVQSGKTLSFTAVTTLARDNNIPLVILLAGTKKNLHAQTIERLKQDLQVSRSNGMPPWELISSPSKNHASDVAGHIRLMARQEGPSPFARTTVITAMKNSVGIGRVRKLLLALGDHGVDLSEVPVLIIDDEADQAGLNASPSDREATATYRAIIELRDSLPKYTYLMYTATPQAPLLIALADAMSPEFVYVLEPGDGYTGGRYFFEEHASTFVHRLSGQAVEESIAMPLQAPPADFMAALATFFLTLSQRFGKGGRASMLVHPSHKTDPHLAYVKICGDIKNLWSRILDEQGQDRDDLVRSWFLPAYKDLLRSNPTLSSLEDLLRDLPPLIAATKVRAINSHSDEEIEWGTAPGWILVGGSKLDRGFTIEDLTTTYMPRSIGVGQVDTIQQRARFFGYKAPYASLCRAWFSDSTATAFVDYVEHEERLRKDLVQLAESGRSLKEWQRAMLLDGAYRPTRRGVIHLPIAHASVPVEEWVSIGRRPYFGPENAALVRSLLDRNGGAMEEDDRDTRLSTTHHQHGIVPLTEVVALLADWRGAPGEDPIMARLLAFVLRARLDENPELRADVYLINSLEPRKRSLRETGLSFQQGRAPQDGGYVGDGAFFAGDLVSVQVHNIHVNGADTPLPSLSSREAGWPRLETLGLSVRLPAEMTGGAVLQQGREG